jgi:DNA-binding transcriptional MerR regulator
MWIAEAAAAAGVNPQTLRYYERRGLMNRVGRRHSGYREYTTEDVRIVRFVKRAQELGFSLEDVAELLRLRSARAGRSAIRTVAERRLRDLESRIADLAAMRDALRTAVKSCHAGSQPACPILEALEGDAHTESRE